ncbi:MAG: PhnD/SsuA/transferrin family substrate-binding protein [Actinomycetota bacterium]
MSGKRLRLLSYMVGGFPLSLFERIADVLDADLEYDLERSGPAPGDDPFADGRADLGWICSTSFVELSTRGPQPSIRIGGVAWVPDDPTVDQGYQDQPVYFGDVVTRDKVGELAALEGRSIGCNDQVSLSGHYALRFALREGGFDPDRFGDLQFTGGHLESLAQVIDGRLDAATIDSVVLTQAVRTDESAAALHRVTRLGPWPTQPLVASSRLPVEQVAELQQALLASNDDPAMRAELQAASLRRFVAVEPDHYDTVRAALARA